jgi:hypothetical protein
VQPRGEFKVCCVIGRFNDGRSSKLLQQGALPSQTVATEALRERQAEIESNLGGPENLSRVHRDAIRDLVRAGPGRGLPVRQPATTRGADRYGAHASGADELSRRAGRIVSIYTKH